MTTNTVNRLQDKSNTQTNSSIGTIAVVTRNLEQCYKVLGLEVGASLEEVNQAYKDLAFIWHPDRVPKDNPRLIEKSAEKIKEINNARDSLRTFYRQNPQAKVAKKTPAKPKYSRDYHSYRPPTRDYRPPYSGYSRQPNPSRERSTYRESASSPRYPYSSYQARQTPPKETYKSDRPTSATPKQSVTANGNGYRNDRKRPYHKDMSEADLRNANLKEKDLAGRNFSKANLSGADLSDTFLHKINLESADLTGANLYRANLLGANLKNAILREANLIGADLSGADLSGADLKGAIVGKGKKVMVKLTGVKLTGATLPNGSVHN